MKVFQEEQKFNSPLVIIGLSTALIVVGFSIFNQWDTISSGGFTSKIAGLSGLFICLLTIAFVASIKLKTKIDEIGVHYQFYPLHLSLKTIKWEEILVCNIRKYDAIWEYGGWGMKFTFFKKKNKCITVKGNIGLQLELKNGTKLLIGTQLEEQMQRTLTTYKHKIKSDEN